MKKLLLIFIIGILCFSLFTQLIFAENVTIEESNHSENFLESILKNINENNYFIFILSLLSIIGFIISVATFIVALKFKDKITNYNEKNKFKTQQEDIVKKFKENYESIHTDGIYQEFILQNIMLDIKEFITKYTFISSDLKKQFSVTYDLILKVCLNEVINNKKSNKLRLCENLTILISLIEKEDTLL